MDFLIGCFLQMYVGSSVLIGNPRLVTMLRPPIVCSLPARFNSLGLCPSAEFSMLFDQNSTTLHPSTEPKNATGSRSAVKVNVLNGAFAVDLSRNR